MFNRVKETYQEFPLTFWVLVITTFGMVQVRLTLFP